MKREMKQTSDTEGDSHSFGTTLNGLDIFIVLLYFISILAVGLWSMWKTNRSTVSGYFLAGRNMIWWPVGASLFSSNVGSGHFIGLAGSGAASGIAVGAYEWNAMFVVLLLGWVFLPIYIASGVVTMPEYLKKRYGGNRIQMCISCVYLFIYIFTKISVDLYAGAIFINQGLKWNLFASVISLLFITAVYTIGGGLAAVIYTDTLQTFIMLTGATLLMIVGFIDIGGYEGLQEAYMRAVPDQLLPNNTECGRPDDSAFHVFRSHDSEFPWTGVVLGMPILSIWYWCTDQVIVQRTLASKNLTHAKGAVLLCSYLKVLPMVLMVMVGMISRAKYPNEVGCVVPELCEKICENPRSCSDIAYPKIVMELLPTGARGLMIAVMLSALMSSLTSIFNSSSTIFTMDLWRYWRPKASERELMITGRVFVLLLVVVSTIWIPIIQAEEGGQLFTYIQKISAYLQPPIAVCFVMGIFWKRTNEQGAFYGLLLGTMVGIARMITDFVYPDPVCGEDDIRPLLVRSVHYLHFAIILAVFTAIVTTGITLCGQSWSDEKLGALTWWTRKELPFSSDSESTSNARTEHTELVEDDHLANQYSASDGVQNQAFDTGESLHSQYTLPVVDTVHYNRSENVTISQRPTSTSQQFDTQLHGVHLDDNNTTTGQSSNDLQQNNEQQSSHWSWSTTGEGNIWKKLLSFLCGYETSTQQPSSTNKQLSDNIIIASLHEDRKWKLFTDINLAVCVVFACFLWAIFR